jgi:hypothetical protein
MRIQGVGSFATRRTSHHGYLPRIHSDGYRDGKVDRGEAATVREVFTRFADGASCKTIAAELNRQGMPSPGSSKVPAENDQEPYPVFKTEVSEYPFAP